MGASRVRSACAFKDTVCHHVDIELLIDLNYDRKGRATLSGLLLWVTFRDRKPAIHESFRS